MDAELTDRGVIQILQILGSWRRLLAGKVPWGSGSPPATIKTRKTMVGFSESPDPEKMGLPKSQGHGPFLKGSEGDSRFIFTIIYPPGLSASNLGPCHSWGQGTLGYKLQSQKNTSSFCHWDRTNMHPRTSFRFLRVRQVHKQSRGTMFLVLWIPNVARNACETCVRVCCVCETCVCV